VIDVAERAVTVAGESSKSTVAPAPVVEKFEPVMVTEVPPATGPVAGETFVTVGPIAVAEGIVKVTVEPAAVPRLFVARTVK
jgi:hypothetical protein